MKKGYQTTEFWLSFVAMLLGAVFASDLLLEGSTLFKALSLASSLLGLMGYTVSRTLVKSAEVKSSALALSALAKEPAKAVKKSSKG